MVQYLTSAPNTTATWNYQKQTFEIDPNTVRGGWCSACGASVQHGESAAMHNRFHDGMISREEANTMSQVLWCDGDNDDFPEGHAFKAGMPGTQSLRGEEIDEDGNVHMVTRDICPKHTSKALRDKLRTAVRGAIYGSPVEDHLD